MKQTIIGTAPDFGLCAVRGVGACPEGETETTTNLMADSERVHKFLSEDLTVRAAGVVATNIIEEMRSLQHTYPIATVAVGRAVVGALLMASHLKHGQELSLYFQGNGPLGTLFAEASYEGLTRGYASNPSLQVQMSGDAIRTGPAIGIGLLTVTHHLPFGDQPHRGTVIIRTGEIGDDIAFYLEQSHQIPSVVSLGVHVDSYGRVLAAGGVLIELMPGHSEETLNKIENRARQAPSISKRILDGATPADLVNDFLGDLKLLPLEHDYPIKYQCRCSQERVIRSLGLLGLAEVDSMLAEKKPVDAVCEFCGRKYEVSLAELEALRSEVYKESLN
ncbi:MAG: Hsp33 family molecular chaperone HslO [Bdellovibrionaceae bacterium]|nr:Hsp33 family molecular chaperone HslO [Pseudobdellovibrionaceae bacterium]